MFALYAIVNKTCAFQDDESEEERKVRIEMRSYCIGIFYLSLVTP
jgi:hypothetical protein